MSYFDLAGGALDGRPHVAHQGVVGQVLHRVVPPCELLAEQGQLLLLVGSGTTQE